MKRRFPVFALCAALAIFGAVLTKYDIVKSINLLVYDFAQSVNSIPANSDIIIVAIDDKSIKQLGRWPWPRQQHAQLIEILNESGAASISYDILFADEDTRAPLSDKSLAKVLSQSSHLTLAMHIEKTSANGQLIEMLPAPVFLQAGNTLGHVHVHQDEDGVARGVFLKEGVGEAFWPHLSLAAFNSLHNQKLRDEHLPGARPSHTKNILKKISQDNAYSSSDTTFYVVRDFFNYVPFSDSDGITIVSFVDVLNENFPTKELLNKSIFVGATATGLGDILTTPIGNMYGVEFNTYILRALQSGSFIREISPNYYWLIVLVASFLTLLFFTRLSPRVLLLTSVGSILSLILMSIILQNNFYLWIPVASFVFVIAVFYPLWNWQRLEIAVRFLQTEVTELKKDSSNSTSTKPTPLPLYNKIEKVGKFLTRTGLLTHFDFQKKKQTTSKDSPVDTRPLISLTDATLRIETCTHIFEGTWTTRAFPKTKSEERDIPTNLHTEKLKPHSLEYRIYAISTLNKLLCDYLSDDKSTEDESRHYEIIGDTIAQLSILQANDQANKRLFRQSLSNLQDALAVLDMFGNILFINEAFKHYFNISNYDNIDSSSADIFELLKPARPLSEKTWQQIIGEIAFTKEKIRAQANKRSSNIDFYFQVSGECIYHEHPDTIIITFTDITRIREAEKEKMEALNFLSHDLRSPMVSVLSIIELEKQKREKEDKEPLSFFEPVELLVRKNLEYADSFLQLSRARSVEQSQFQLCDMHALLDSAHSIALAKGQAKNIHVDAIRPNDDAWILGDNDLLDRAISNLVSNAIKYSPAHTTITLSLSVTSTHVVLSIKDEGVGIGKNDIPYLFDRFVRAKTQINERGAGLGLHFVKTVVNRHNGEIHVNSQLNEGSIFSMSLPIEHV